MHEHTTQRHQNWKVIWMAAGEDLGTYPTEQAAREAIEIKTLLPTGDPELPAAHPWEFDIIPV